jgi:hypothetical protein
MNIDDNVNQIVQNIVNQITAQVQAQAMSAITSKINEVIDNMDTTSMLATILSQKLDARISQLPIDTGTIESTLVNRVNDLATSLSNSVYNKAVDQINTTIADNIATISFRDLCQSALISALNSSQFRFIDNSIPGTAIQKDNLKINGDQIVGGIIKQFGSTGIDDKSTGCQLTIMDDITVIENNLLTKDLTVKGTTTIEGDLNVTGTMPESSPLFQNIVNAATNNVRTSLDSVVFQTYADMVFSNIKEKGLDLTKITVNGTEVINGSNLSNSITYSNLQRVGQLQELQVAGESLLSGTLYTTKQRIGINTIEPAQALSIWDQEVEIGIGKQSNNTAIIGTPRNHTLIISSNGKNNLTLTPDGAIAVNQINIGNTAFTSASAPPSNDQPKGMIVFNSNPSLGGPLGWVSLGNAQWANFGVID